ncbi:MAG: hypothetical protein QM538_07510 [Methylacidiphilales bacterium]|nr:hypothetical protein [Candidatus Methylacidiphilales bacterium]
MKSNNYQPKTINRTIAIVQRKEAFISWITEKLKAIDTNPTLPQVSGYDSKYTFLLPTLETSTETDSYLQQHCAKIIEFHVLQILGDEHKDLLPNNMDWQLFTSWFSYEAHSVIIDLDEQTDLSQDSWTY